MFHAWLPRLTAVTLVGFSLLVGSREASAQARSMFPGGQGQTGGNRAGGMAMGAGGMGTGGMGMGGMGMGAGGMGMGGMGMGAGGMGMGGGRGGGMGMGGMGMGMNGFGNAGQMGMGGMQTNAGTGFIGQAPAGQGFIGVQNGTQRTNVGRTQMGGARRGTVRNMGMGGVGGGANPLAGFGATTGIAGMNGRAGGRNQFGQQAGTAANIAPRHRIAFEYTAPGLAQMNARIGTRIEGFSSRSPAFAGVNVVVNEQGQATLQGTVPTNNSRRLAENLIRLEPGVRSINNELAVAPTESANP
jgi:hypothetical protein